MKITTKEQYDILPNGTIFKLFLSGDGWGDDVGEVQRVIKQDNKLYIITDQAGYYDFTERYEPDYEFDLAYKET